MRTTPCARQAYCRTRSTKGQALVEGASMLVVMTIVIALLLLGLLNTYILGAYNLKMQPIAASAARRVAACKWWLGMIRPEYNQREAEIDAEQALNGELKSVGLPEANNVKFSYSTVMLRKKLTTIVRVDFDVNKVKIAQGLFFPSFITLHASGVSSDAEHAVTRHGQATIHAQDPSDPASQRAIRVPVYNATVGLNRAAHPRWLRADRGTGTYPVAYLRLDCDSEGSRINKQGTNPATNRTEVTDEAIWDQAYDDVETAAGADKDDQL
jgi:hypothetical protein